MIDATRNLLEQHFDTAFAAPDGITKLRELILTLAMQGKLVEQDANDTLASELLKEIEAEKQRLVKAGKIKKPKPLPPIKPEEVPYELPRGWEWVRLGEITDYNGRKNISGDEIGPDTWLLDLEDIEKGTSRILYRANFSERKSKSTKSTFKKGDVLYGKLRPYLDKVIVADSDGVCTTEIVPIVPFRGLNAEYLRWLLKRPAFLAHVNSLMYGVKMPRLGTDDAVTSVHPLPPLLEQHRIVARIDQLMARCDELDKLRKEREEKRLTVHAAAIRQLLDPSLRAFAASREENSSNLRAFVTSCEPFEFLAQHFGELYTVKENVAELRKAILQLAVMGRLVPQDPNDPPASKLLKEIEAEKQRLVKAGKIKKPKPLPPIKPEEVLYELPQGWEWVRLGNLNPEYQNGISKRGSNDGRETIVLRLADIAGNEVSLVDTRSIQLTEKELEKYLLKDGDILITRVNGSIDLVGSFIRVRQIQRPLAYCDHFIRVQLPLKFVDVDYLHTISRGTLVRRQIEGKFVTTAGQKTVNQTHITTLVLPLPPLPEQHRIVARIDQLMALCDTLDQQIDTATGKQTELLNAVMAGV